MQGLTEFLPVSSSGHLVIAQHLFGFAADDAPLLFDTVLHLGSLTAVLAVFGADILAIVRDVWAVLRIDGLRAGWARRPHLRLLVWMVVATLPAVVVGVTMKDTIEQAFTSVKVVGVALLITAGLLLISRRFANRTGNLTTMNAGQALIVGLFQAAAITPGLSRSGSTIVGGMIAGLDRETAARFSFLISIPAILGAALLESLDAPALPPGFGPAAAAGFVSSTVVGYGALRLLLRFVRQGHLHWFGFYCMLVAIVAFFL